MQSIKSISELPEGQFLRFWRFKPEEIAGLDFPGVYVEEKTDGIFTRVWIPEMVSQIALKECTKEKKLSSHSNMAKFINSLLTDENQLAFYVMKHENNEG